VASSGRNALALRYGCHLRLNCCEISNLSLRDLVRDLDRRVVQTREVLDLLAGFERDEAGDEQARVVVAICRVEPQFVADDGAAEIGAEIVVARELVVARVVALIAQILGHVVALKGAVLPGRQVHAVELVAAGFDDIAQRQPRTLRFRTLCRR
jgi:hypothetical protein